MGKKIKHQNAKDKFDDFEHVRRLNAMSKRILSLGKPHERKKNINDPIANPTYFFRKPGDDAAIKLVSLNNFNEKLKELVSEEIFYELIYFLFRIIMTEIKCYWDRQSITRCMKPNS